MVGEGQYPKIDGDILYASEVNSYRESLSVIASSGPTPYFSSGPTSHTFGSVVIPANTLRNPCNIKINCRVVGNTTLRPMIRISGLSVFEANEIYIGDERNNYIITTEMFLGSPLSGTMYTWGHPVGNSQDALTAMFSAAVASNVNIVNDPLVIFFRGLAGANGGNSGSTSYSGYIIQANKRGTIS